MTATTSRGCADIADFLGERTARQAELSERLALTSANLHTIRGARARAVAEGKKGPSAAEIATLAEEHDGIGAALALLAEDVTALEAEAATAALAEAEQAQLAAIGSATDAMTALDLAVRSTAEQSVIPAHDAFTVAMTLARRADDALDHLKRKASAESLPILPGKAEKVIQRRGALLALITSMRAYVAAGGPAVEPLT